MLRNEEKLIGIKLLLILEMKSDIINEMDQFSIELILLSKKSKVSTLTNKNVDR